jgi:hypothetical protein
MLITVLADASQTILQSLLPGQGDLRQCRVCKQSDPLEIILICEKE